MTSKDKQKTIEVSNVAYEVTGNGIPGRPPDQQLVLRKTTRTKHVVDEIGEDASTTVAAWPLGTEFRQKPVYSVTVTNADQLAPTTPANVMATTESSNEVDLTWNFSADPGTNATGVKAYNVYRDGVFLLQVAASNNFTADTSVRPSTTNNYIVTAVDYAYNQSTPSSQADAP